MAPRIGPARHQMPIGGGVLRFPGMRLSTGTVDKVYSLIHSRRSTCAAETCQGRNIPRNALPGDSSHLSSLLSVVNVLAFVAPPQCFNTDCQATKDIAFVFSLILPILAFCGAAVLVFRRQTPSPDKITTIFDDPETGTVFQGPEGVEPARDQRGELAFRAVSYTPWPVDTNTGGKPVRIGVGKVGGIQPRTFLFEKVLPQPSELVVARLSRPLGIVFEEDARAGRAIIAELVPGGHAERLWRRASLDPGFAATAPAVGDVLRACTATNIVYPTGALMFGAQKPERAVVVFGADGQRWPAVAAALKKGLVADGDVTLVLERRLTSDAE